MQPVIRLLILGTGNMAAAHVAGFRSVPGCRIVAGVDTTLARARAFCRQHAIPRAFAGLDAALAWGQFDAVANVTPDGIHHPTTMRLLAAGKHVLCEKPLAETYPLAREMADAAEAAGLVGMVNLSYRNVAALQEARALVGRGALGQIRHVEASYRQSWLVANTWGDWKTEDRWLWRLSTQHGSKGVLGDVGIHILDFVTWATDLEPVSLQARVHTFPKAEGDRIGAYPLDANDSAVMSVAFANGALGVIHTSRFMTGYTNTLRLQVFGTAGALELEHNLAGTRLMLCDGDRVHDQSWREVRCNPVETNFARFVEAIRTGRTLEPSFRRGAELQRVLDACFEPAAQRDMRLVAAAPPPEPAAAVTPDSEAPILVPELGRAVEQELEERVRAGAQPA
ncbi:MAG: Gfo/Idh/MocA family oxidoreductase [Geminicoccaceae bacterium]